MQVTCSTCSRPIALTDTIQSSQGYLSHANCAQHRTLTVDERTLLFVYCTDHVVGQCLRCSLSFRLHVEKLSLRMSARTCTAARSFHPKYASWRMRCGRRRSTW